MTRRRVAEICGGYGFTREELAQLLGVDLSTVCRWENHAQKPDGSSARFVAILCAFPGHRRRRIGHELRGELAFCGPLHALHLLLSLYFEHQAEGS